MINSVDSVMGKWISGKGVERAAEGSKDLLLYMRAGVISLYEQDPNYDQISQDFVID